MTPPFIARALIAATAPASDYESVDGDLLEEYALRVRQDGRSAADRWYSRSQGSLADSIRIAGIVVAVLFAMILCKGFTDDAIDALIPGGRLPHVLYFSLDWLIAALFGGALALIVRAHGTRIALIAAFVLLLGFATPILIGVSPRLPAAAWLLILGAIPAMSAGAALVQILRRTT
jgi:hypothetical protein